MKLFGVNGLAAMAVVQSVASALIAPLTALAGAYVFARRRPALLAGLLVALWYPQFLYVGYFSSETPYAFFLALSLWATLRAGFTGRGGLLAGLATGIAFTIRPQIILTVALLGLWAIFRRRELPGFRLRTAVAFALPLVAILAFSTWRYHRITGEWHLISDNGSVGRLFASTEYKRIESYFVAKSSRGKKDREYGQRMFQPPATRQIGNRETFRFEGYIADDKILTAERKRFLADKTPLYRLWLLQRNIPLLVYRNQNWPEKNAPKGVVRAVPYHVWPVGEKLVLAPLALVAMFLLTRRKNLALEVIALHVLTMIYAAAMYFAEVRYRMPYDPALLLLCIFAVLTLRRRTEMLAPQPTWIRIGGALVTGAFLALMLAPWRVFDELADDLIDDDADGDVAGDEAHDGTG